MAPFYGWGSTVSRLEPLRGGSLLFTTKSPEIPGTHFIDLRRMKGALTTRQSSALTTVKEGLLFVQSLSLENSYLCF